MGSCNIRTSHLAGNVALQVEHAAHLYWVTQLLMSNVMAPWLHSVYLRLSKGLRGEDVPSGALHCPFHLAGN